MSLKQDIADMRCASLVLDLAGVPEWATMLRNIATSADNTDATESTMERWRWSPVVVNAGELSRKIMLAAEHIAVTTGDVL